MAAPAPRTEPGTLSHRKLPKVPADLVQEVLRLNRLRDPRIHVEIPVGGKDGSVFGIGDGRDHDDRHVLQIGVASHLFADVQPVQDGPGRLPYGPASVIFIIVRIGVQPQAFGQEAEANEVVQLSQQCSMRGTHRRL